MAEAMAEPRLPAPELATAGASELAERTINTVRTLSMDAVEAAASGHPGTPMGLAPLAYALWTGAMKYDSRAPDWPDRDRFVLSCGHASMLLYSMLHLTGYPLALEDIRRFRQLGSPAAGHPERGELAGVETTTGPLGQGFGNAVGMALAERLLAARFNSDDCVLVDHRVWVLASDGDLMEGVASEAASLAGHLGLSKLCVFWDDNRITIDGKIDLSFSEDVAQRFAAYGWNVLRVDVAEGIEAYADAVAAARRETTRPTFVACRTHIGHGSPGKQDRSAAHGAPLGADEVRATKRRLGWPEDASFLVPDDVAEHMATAGVRGTPERRAWERRLEGFRNADPQRARDFEDALHGRLPEGALDAIPDFAAGERMATRKASGKVLAAVGARMPLLIGGSADLAGSNLTTMPGAVDVRAGAFAGRTIHFGVREHAMGAILNGMALHGGIRPYGGTFLVFSDYMRPSIRLAALMQLPVVYVFTHDSIGVGEDGPTHQPIEQLAALRAIPGLSVIRPADANETAEAWRLALESTGPVAMILTRQSVPTFDREGRGSAAGVRRGAYVLHEGGLHPDVLLLATGSEVAVAMAAAERLREEGVTSRVVSMPCWERFDALPAEEQATVLGDARVRIGIEAGTSMGWHRYVGPGGILVTLDRFGASAPGPVLMEHFGFTPERVAELARRRLAELEQGQL